MGCQCERAVQSSGLERAAASTEDSVTRTEGTRAGGSVRLSRALATIWLGGA